MNTYKLIQICGSIIKEESIVPITANIMEHTCVAEANLPYSNYYGVAPFNMPTKPNSLYLFTEHHYTLEEAHRYVQLIDLCCKQTLNVAASVLEFKDGQYPAIRIKNLPEYKMIRSTSGLFC
jgi:hypothetical protein